MVNSVGKNREKPVEHRTLFICGVDWDHEIGETSIHLAKTRREVPRCQGTCGRVRLEIYAHWETDQDLGMPKKKRRKNDSTRAKRRS